MYICKSLRASHEALGTLSQHLGSQGEWGRGLAFGGRLPAAIEVDNDASPSRLTASDELIEPSFERDRSHEAAERLFLQALLRESESNDKLWGDGGVTSPTRI